MKLYRRACADVAWMFIGTAVEVTASAAFSFHRWLSARTEVREQARHVRACVPNTVDQPSGEATKHP